MVNKVYTGGTFDLFHSGHVNFLRMCKKIAGEEGLINVALNTDKFIKEFKGKAPIFSYEQRRGILLACRYVDQVFPNEYSQDSKPTIEYINPNFIVVGDDWAKKDYYKQMSFTQEWLDGKDITLIYVPYTQGISTTEIKSKLKNEI